MVISKIPYRVSLFGGGCDYPEYYLGRGAKVISFAIDKYMYVSVAPRFEDGYRVSYTLTEITNSREEIQHKLVRGALIYYDITEPLEITTIGELPGGTGLASSAAVMVGLVTALNQYKHGRQVAGLDLYAWQIERGMGYSPGQQDHIRCFRGDEGVISFGEKGYTNIPKNLPLEHFILIYTGIRRPSETILKQQLEQPNIAYLNEIQDVTNKALDALEWGEIKRLGPLLDSSWRLKKYLADGIDNDEIDGIYQLGKSLGATGGKVCGAGGGGFMLFFHPGDTLARQMFVDRMGIEGYKNLPFGVGYREVYVI